MNALSIESRLALVELVKAERIVDGITPLAQRRFTWTPQDEAHFQEQVAIVHLAVFNGRR